jgi:hypothetical protein
MIQAIHIGADGIERPCEVLDHWPDIGIARCQSSAGEGWAKFFGVYDAAKARAAGYEIEFMQQVRLVEAG